MKNTPKLILFSSLMVSVASVVSAANVFFTGASSDQYFSNEDNWDSSLPSAGDNVGIEITGTSASSPAIVDANYNSVLLAQVWVHSGGTAADGGISYLEVASGGTLAGHSIRVGHNVSQYYDGSMIVRSGGNIRNNGGNAGYISVGNELNANQMGDLLIEAGASIEHAKVFLYASGAITFELEADQVGTIHTIQTSSGSTNLLDGLVQVDLSALPTIGSYTLIDSNSSNLLLSGQLITDLATAGGTITSSTESTSFNVLNERNYTWNLTTGEGGQDLIFNVTSIPEPNSAAFFLGLGSIALLALRRVR